MIVFQCPKCGREIKAPFSYGGKSERCPGCKKKVTIPVGTDADRDPIAVDSTAPPIICPNPNCGYKGTPARQTTGSLGMLLILFFLGVLPGILYALMCYRTQVICPKCGIKIRD
jgi:hypothetical protein